MKTNDKNVPTLHLTLSGLQAGRPICQAPRNETDEYIHYGACYTGKPKADNLCVRCSELWDEFELEQDVDEPDSVDLIASGYEWICPKCDTLNKEIETSERVTCSSCGASWPVSDYYHAEG